MSATSGTGPIVFAYDGSELAKHAIEEAGRLFGHAERDAVVVTVWQPFDVGFEPVGPLGFEASDIAGVREAAEAAAAAGAALAEAAGFRATSAEVEAQPAWKGIAGFADSCDASLIVLGSHGRSGFPDALFGSVASAVAAHSRRSVLIVHRPPAA
jgi:nucleotide-binding universal stress UspA family protein